MSTTGGFLLYRRTQAGANLNHHGRNAMLNRPTARRRQRTPTTNSRSTYQSHHTRFLFAPLQQFGSSTSRESFILRLSACCALSLCSLMPPKHTNKSSLSVLDSPSKPRATKTKQQKSICTVESAYRPALPQRSGWRLVQAAFLQECPPLHPSIQSLFRICSLQIFSPRRQAVSRPILRELSFGISRASGYWLRLWLSRVSGYGIGRRSMIPRRPPVRRASKPITLPTFMTFDPIGLPAHLDFFKRNNTNSMGSKSLNESPGVFFQRTFLYSRRKSPTSMLHLKLAPLAARQ
ncbi:hypothetical protein C8R43DRAFT_963500 [Mycena crocata]|nr:hypothetical protein C8R43DRAFT_963500 [Mycena crocata]